MKKTQEGTPPTPSQSDDRDVRCPDGSHEATDATATRVSALIPAARICPHGRNFTWTFYEKEIRAWVEWVAKTHNDFLQHEAPSHYELENNPQGHDGEGTGQEPVVALEFKKGTVRIPLYLGADPDGFLRLQTRSVVTGSLYDLTPEEARRLKESTGAHLEMAKWWSLEGFERYEDTDSDSFTTLRYVLSLGGISENAPADEIEAAIRRSLFTV